MGNQETIRRRELTEKNRDQAADAKMAAEDPAVLTARSHSAPLRIAKVDDDSAGGGFYYAKLQKIDAVNWDTDAGAMVDDAGGAIIVANLPEIGSANNGLDAGDLMFVWQERDDSGVMRWVGIEAFGRKTFGFK